MKASVEQINSVQSRVKVECDSSDVNVQFEKAYRNVKKNARIHGFRPGKAPLHMIRKMYGTNVAVEVADSLVQAHLFAAMEAESLSPVARPVLETVDLPKEGEGYTFTVLVDLMPKVEVKDYKGLKLEYTEMPDLDEALEKELKGLQRSQAKTKNLEEGAVAAEGHLVTFDQEVKKADGSLIESMSAKDVSVDLGSGQLLAKIDDALLGSAKGDHCEVPVTLEEDYEDKELAGKQVTFSLTVTNVQELSSPAIDDELAVDLGLENLEDLKSKLKERMVMQSEELKARQLETSALNQLAQKNAFEVPPSMVDQSIDGLIEGQLRGDKKEAAKQKNDPKIREIYKEQARSQVHNSLILLDIIKQEELELTDEDIENHFKKVFSMSGMNELPADMLKTLKKNFKDEEKHGLLLKKALDKVIDYAQVTATPAS